MELLVMMVLHMKQMLSLSLHQVWWHGGNMHTLLGEGYWIVMASVEGLLRRFVLDLQSWYVVKQFLVATGKLLNPDPRRLSTGQLRSLSMAPLKAGHIIIGAPVRYCYYCSAGIARTVYTISTSPRYLLPKRHHVHHHDTSKNARHRKHHAQALYRMGQHFRVKGQGQISYQAFSVPRGLCQKDSEDDGAAAATSGGRHSPVFVIEASNQHIHSNSNTLHSNNIHNNPNGDASFENGTIATINHENNIHNNSDSICVNSIRDGYSDLPLVARDIYDDSSADQVCPFHAPHVLGEDPKYSEILKQYNTRLSLYRKLPWKTISRLWGQFNQLELPVWLRGPAFNLYIWMFQCKLHEASVTDLSSYRNLSEFFRRTLRAGVRPVDGAHVLTSPADGTILYQSEVVDGVLEQVKGVAYSLPGFMGPKAGLLFQRNVDVDCGYIETLSDTEYASSLLSNPKDNVLYHSITYLAPGDYHRFHSPADWTVHARRHFPGELFSVKPGVARWLQGLFNYNERTVYTGRWRYGFFSMTAVGATNVGSINVNFDKDLYTNCPDDKNHEVFYDATFLSKKKSGIQMKKGQLMGDFNLGSTIVLIFEAPKKFKFTAGAGQKVKYGQGMGLCQKRRRHNNK